MAIEQRLRKLLQKRKEDNALRTLVSNRHLIDFCSNDYLGFARSEELQNRIHTKLATLKSLGATGSRLLTGQFTEMSELETFIAQFHKAEAALLFNSGYSANLGLLSAVCKRGDCVLYDELAHASIRDGIQLSRAKSFSFRHNDLEDLRRKLKKMTGPCFVIVESVYSMDGDEAPLESIATVCEELNAYLIVDEAHSTGVIGAKGQGSVVNAALENKIFARIHTFGKAIGYHGAAVLGSKDLIDYLINFSRPFIYTTALPLHSVLTIHEAYLFLNENSSLITSLNGLIQHFLDTIPPGLDRVKSTSAIQTIIIPGNKACREVSDQLKSNGFDVRAILSPTVAEGKERLRVCLHTFNSKENISVLNSLLQAV